MAHYHYHPVITRVLIVTFLLVAAAAQEQQPQQTIEFQAPVMTEDLRSGGRMPKMYECVGCHAVIFQINQTFDKKHNDAMSRLSEVDYVDILETTCKEAFGGIEQNDEKYLLANIGGKTVLKGPGIDKNYDEAQGYMQMGGGKFPSFLQAMCGEIVFDKLGETEIYDHYFTSETKHINKYHICGPEVLNLCTEEESIPSGKGEEEEMKKPLPKKTKKKVKKNSKNDSKKSKKKKKSKKDEL